MKKLIELWKPNCEHCEAVKPIVAELEKEGFTFEKHNIEEKEGFILMNDYIKEIEQNNERLGSDAGFIYTPTFINPQTRKVTAFNDREPTKEELLQLLQGGEII